MGPLSQCAVGRDPGAVVGAPGTVGEFENNLVLEVVDFAQPAVIGDVVPVHEGLWQGGGEA